METVGEVLGHDGLESRVVAKVTVEKLLSIMKPRDAYILWAVYIQGMTLHEAGRALGLSYQRVHQIRKEAIEYCRAVIG